MDEHVNAEDSEFIRQADLSNDEVFAEVVRRVIHSIGATAVSSALRVSIPTVDRWAYGITTPHERMREPIRRLAMKEKADPDPGDLAFYWCVLEADVVVGYFTDASPVWTNDWRQARMYRSASEARDGCASRDGEDWILLSVQRVPEAAWRLKK